MHLLIDADPIVYRVGFANETRNYGAVAEDALGNLYDGFFEPSEKKTALANLNFWLEENDLTLVDRWPVVHAGPISHVLHSVRMQVESIQAETGATSTSIILSGPGNFREGVAKQRPYKGNRDPDHKPAHYQNIRDYLVSQYGARVVHGREADDEVSILARRAAAVVATIDKDLDQIPGEHYDYLKKVSYTVTEEEAERWFWVQALAGDMTDNIPGCYRIGGTKAAEFVDLARAKPVSDNDMWELVKFHYTLSTKVKGCPYTAEQAEAVALETARLVYMQREPWELWTPPGSPKQYMKPSGRIGSNGYIEHRK